MISIKLHEIIREHQKIIILAACDSVLLGKKLKENNLELEVSEKFYKGKEVSEKELINLLQDCDSANFVGEETINILIKHKIVKPEDIMRINGIPHIQIF
ncbi:MAG: DUF424 family protein [Candidatus Nanoarchaeia archaeon]|nr:DUF424 family protein [Candidatus Nanoarchaeia archaeon]